MEKTESSNYGISLASGAAAGLIADLVVHPLDTIRARLQTKSGNYKSIADGITSIFKAEGFRALYKGLGVVSLFTVPAHALYFGGYELSKSLLQRTKANHEKSPWVHFVSGIWAEVAGSIVWVPMDIIKQKLQVQKGMKYRHSFDVVKDIIRHEGFRGMYRGTIAALLTYCPFVGLYFTLYEFWMNKSTILFHKNREDLNFTVQLTGGFVAAAIASAVTNPLDVLKTNLQVYSVREGGHVGLWSAFKVMYKEVGYKDFARGLNARILWIATGCAVTMASYEQCKALFASTSLNKKI